MRLGPFQILQDNLLLIRGCGCHPDGPHAIIRKHRPWVVSVAWPGDAHWLGLQPVRVPPLFRVVSLARLHENCAALDRRVEARDQKVILLELSLFDATISPSHEPDPLSVAVTNPKLAPRAHDTVWGSKDKLRDLEIRVVA